MPSQVPASQAAPPALETSPAARRRAANPSGGLTAFFL